MAATPVSPPHQRRFTPATQRSPRVNNATTRPPITHKHDNPLEGASLVCRFNLSLQNLKTPECAYRPFCSGPSLHRDFFRPSFLAPAWLIRLGPFAGATRFYFCCWLTPSGNHAGTGGAANARTIASRQNGCCLAWTPILQSSSRDYCSRPCYTAASTDRVACR